MLRFAEEIILILLDDEGWQVRARFPDGPSTTPWPGVC